jgi:hypothetical protein
MKPLHSYPLHSYLHSAAAFIPLYGVSFIPHRALAEPTDRKQQAINTLIAVSLPMQGTNCGARATDAGGGRAFMVWANTAWSTLGAGLVTRFPYLSPMTLLLRCHCNGTYCGAIIAVPLQLTDCRATGRRPIAVSSRSRLSLSASLLPSHCPARLLLNPVFAFARCFKRTHVRALDSSPVESRVQ